MAGQKDKYKNPSPTVDIIIELEGGDIVLIERKNPPHGWAIPGGFVDEGECVENAAVREAKEETCLDVDLEALLYVYSNPSRDPRVHTMSTVFVASSSGTPVASDDAKDVGTFALDALPEDLCFDHAEILADYKQWRATGERPKPGDKLARYTESAE
jgi:8-oxo-dGTP diphosphatase